MGSRGIEFFLDNTIVAAFGVFFMRCGVRMGPGTSSQGQECAPGESFLGRTLDCFYCLSLWLAIPFAFIASNHPLGVVVAWPAISGAAIRLSASQPNLATGRLSGGKSTTAASTTPLKANRGEQSWDVAVTDAWRNVRAAPARRKRGSSIRSSRAGCLSEVVRVDRPQSHPGHRSLYGRRLHVRPDRRPAPGPRRRCGGRRQGACPAGPSGPQQRFQGARQPNSPHSTKRKALQWPRSKFRSTRPRFLNQSAQNRKSG